MSRGFWRSACLFVCGWMAAGGVDVPAQQATFRARTDVVVVPVSVMKGREPVTGLTAADFAITDNGVRQTVDSVVSDQVAIDVTLVLTGRSFDRGAEHENSLVSAERTRTLLNPADRLRMVWVTDEIAGSVVGPDFSIATDPSTQALRHGLASPTGAQPDRRSGLGVALADGLFYALAWPVEPDRRHLAVVFTDGSDTTSTIDMDTLQQLAAHSDAVLHAVFWAAPGEDARNAGGLNIVAGPVPVDVGRWRRSFDTLIDSVHQSGGTIHRTGNAADALGDILADFRSSYTLRYSPRGVSLGGWHELDVKVTRPGSFKVRARKGYEGGAVSIRPFSTHPK